MNETITGLLSFLSFLFTIFVLSYVIGDSPLFRLSVHAFVGTAAGYVTAIVVRQVLVDKLIMPLLSGTPADQVLMIFPLIFVAMMFIKMAIPKLEWIGRPAEAFMVGVGTATVVAGAILGTIFPQMDASVKMFDLSTQPDLIGSFGGLVAGIFVLFGTVATLAYFQFTLRSKPNFTGNRGKIASFFALLGQIFISITLGAIFAGVLAAALTAFVDRISAIVLFLEELIKLIQVLLAG